MTRQLTQSVRLAVVGGVRALVVDFDIPEDAPESIREGLARRRIVNGGGVCPCGARVTLPNRAARRRGQVLAGVVEHEPGCPAATDFLRPLLDEWEAGR